MGEDGSFDILRARRIVLQGKPSDTAIVESDGTDLKGTSVEVPEGETGLLVPDGWGLAGGGAIATAGTRGMNQNGLYYATPWQVLRDQTVTDVRVNVTTGSGTELRIGIIEVSGDPSGFVTPVALALDAGTVDPGTTGIKSLSGLSGSLVRGKWYCSVAISDGAGTFISKWTTYSPTYHNTLDSNNAASGTGRIAFVASQGDELTGGFSDPPAAPTSSVQGGASPNEFVQIKSTAV